MGLWLLIISLLFLSRFHIFHAKECTNTPTHYFSTKAKKYEFFTSRNETWKKKIMSHAHAHAHSHHHVTPTDESAWASLFPRKILREEDESNWNALYKKIKFINQNNLEGSFLQEISLHNVRVDPGSLHGRAQHTNLQYLLMLEVDRLVWSFRKTAGLPTPGLPYGGWEAPNVELRGHFVGHYLSAMAKMWASTHDWVIWRKMNALVAALKECQDKIGTGYLSAFPPSFFDRVEGIQPVWAPYYTIHKIMAGLLDQYKFGGDSRALKMVSWMADYFYWRVRHVIRTYTIERHWLILNEETGGMNDVLYQLYNVTGHRKHLILAHLFDKPCFLGLLTMGEDDISGFHANTHIPIVVGAQKRYELTGDDLYKKMATNFLDSVNSTHTFATGGTSASEFWYDPMRLADVLNTEDEESCTTYNMLKVSRNLFRWTKQAAYADYYERALTNGVLSIQRGTEPGVMIYMLPLGHGVSKGRSFHGWGTPNNSFWCCYGTGIESFSKLGDSIYFEEMRKKPELYVTQYISSSLKWTSAKISLALFVDDVVSWDMRLKASIIVFPEKGAGMSTLNLRIPSWTSLIGLKASLNGKPLSVPNPGNFLPISKVWEYGDQIALEFPLILRTETIQDDRPQFATLQAILYGPYLLAGLSNGDYDIQTGTARSIHEWIKPLGPTPSSLLISLSQGNQNSKFFLSVHKILVKMQESILQAGNDSNVHATFRLIMDDPFPEKLRAPGGLMGKRVMFEPFDRPGVVVAHRGANGRLTIVHKAHNNGTAEFFIVKGLNGRNGTVSLRSQEGCYVYSGRKYADSLHVRLGCELSEPLSGEFKEAASFVWNNGLKQPNPISFVATGLRRSYVLEPLLALRDEFYNVYFNITRY